MVNGFDNLLPIYHKFSDYEWLDDKEHLVLCRRIISFRLPYVNDGLIQDTMSDYELAEPIESYRLKNKPHR